MDLNEAKALVTGGSSGIGKATARALRERGSAVVVCARGEERLRSAADEIGATPLVADVSVEEDVVRLVSEAREALGGLDILINNAAYGRFSPLVEIETSEFRRLLETNVVGAMMVAREAARHFVRQSSGHIVNISSTAGSKGFSGGSAYVASKFALGGMTECWRSELRRHDVRVMQVNPSEVQTGFASSAGYDQEASDRKLFPEDIAGLIVSMLELPDRGFVTDATIWATNPPRE